MRGRTTLGLLGTTAATAALAGCASAPQPQRTPTPKPSATPLVAATPQPTPSLPAGPFAVVVSNAQRTGTTYEVLLINDDAQIIAQVTAQLPHLKPNQSVQLPLLSASQSAVYYLDGDTTIRSLTPGGIPTVAKTIEAGASGEIAFAVSADGSRIAVADIVEQADPSKDTGAGYVEDMSDSNGHVSLWSNTSTDAARWPVGWRGDSVIDAVGYFTSGGCYGGPPCPTNVNSYHVVSSSGGSRIATVCETPATEPTGAYDYYNLMGSPVAAGVACMENEQQQSGSTFTWTSTLEAVDWTGAEHDFVTASSTSNGDPLQLGDCFLAPDGSRALCEEAGSSALVLVTSSGAQNNLGRRYNPLGWIDSTHVLVEVDSGHLAVLDPDTASVTTLAISGADQMTMPATLPSQV